MNAINLFRLGTLIGPVSAVSAGITLAQLIGVLGHAASEEKTILLSLTCVLYLSLAVIGWRLTESAKQKDPRLANYKSDMLGSYFVRNFLVTFGGVISVDSILEWIENGVLLTWVSEAIFVASVIALIVIALIWGIVLFLRDNSIEQKLANQPEQIVTEPNRG